MQRRESQGQFVAAESDGGIGTRSISIDLTARDGVTGEDVLDAARKSCEEYVRTEDGKRTYDYNCGAFNYGDFDVYVPNEICKKYGIEKNLCVSEMIGGLEFGEQLVDEAKIQREREAEEERETEEEL